MLSAVIFSVFCWGDGSWNWGLAVEVGSMTLGWFDQMKTTHIGGVESCGKWWDGRGKVQGLYIRLLELQFHSHPISEV